MTKKTNCDKVLDLFYKDGVGVTPEGKKLKEFIIIGINGHDRPEMSILQNANLVEILEKDYMIEHAERRIKALEYMLNATKNSLEKTKNWTPKIDNQKTNLK